MNEKPKSLQQLAWKRLKKNRLALVSICFVFICIFISVFCYLLVSDHTPDANTMIPQLALKHVGFSVKMLEVKKDKQIETAWWKKIFSGSESEFQDIPITFYRQGFRSLEFGLYGMSNDAAKIKSLKYTDILFAVSDEDTATIFRNDSLIITNVYGKKEGDLISKMFPRIENENIITQKYWLGTDQYGRDILSRLLIGLRISLSVGFISVLISIFIGIALGMLAGYFGGRTDALISWLINVTWAVPTILIVFALSLALGKGFWQIFVAVGLTMWVSAARLVRGQVMVERKKEYVEAAKSLGYKHSRILFKHILPNILGPVLVIAASNFATAILIEAGLSFLGIGVQPPTPSWGSMLRENYGFIVSGNPMMAVVPGLSIVVLVLAFNVVGNGLRDALDVKTKS